MKEHLNLERQQELKQWTNPDIFKNRFDNFRKFYRNAARETVLEVLNENTESGDRILEIGSGMGELAYNLAPEYGSRIQQTDASLPTVREHKRVREGSNIMVADVYDLPFETASVDVITGYSAFDVYGDLPAALNEMKRVLKSSGKIIHFLDAIACSGVINPNAELIGNVAFNLGDFNGDKETIWIMPKEYYDNKMKEVEPWFVDFMKLYLGMNGSSRTIELLHEKHRDIFETVSNKINSTFKDDCVKKTTANQFFYENIKTGLNDLGFKIKQCQEVKNAIVVDRDMDIYREQNVIVHDSPGYCSGFYSEEMAAEYGKDKAMVTSTLHVVVAQK